jgi:chorismate lyase/3-hydroxybenzoate synthase
MGIIDNIRYAHDDELLFAWLHLDEAALVSMERASLRAYVRLDRLLARLGFPYWLRAWNYLARITEGEGEQERYRQFNVGRFRALALKPGFEQALPAATAIGTHGGGLMIGLLAGRCPALQVENPRQVSAFRYPPRYGLCSPSFSRATLQHWRERSLLFLSGTASVVGHMTQCSSDSRGQLEETLCNIETLLAHAVAQHFPGRHAGEFQPQTYKVYVRSLEVHGDIAAHLNRALAARAPTLVLQGEICRPDLLLEVEGVYGVPAESAR